MRDLCIFLRSSRARCFSRSRVRTPAHAARSFYWSQVRFRGLVACFRPVESVAYVTRPHDWRIRLACGKIKPPWGKNLLSHGLWKNLCEGKNPVKPLPACKNLVVQVKIQAGLWHVPHTWWYVSIISVSACGEGDWCHCCVQFVTCTIYCLYITLRSQDDDFHPHKTLIVQSYELCDSPRITVIQTLLAG